MTQPTLRDLADGLANLTYMTKQILIIMIDTIHLLY